MDDINRKLDLIIEKLDSMNEKSGTKFKSGESSRLKKLEEIIQKFVGERCTVNPLRERSTRETYDAFVAWCSHYKIDQLHQTTFGKVLLRCYPGVMVIHKSFEGRPIRHYKGIGVNPYWAGNPEPPDDDDEEWG